MKSIFDALATQLTNPEIEELVIGVPEEDSSDSHFSRSGCDLISTLACDVYDVKCVIFTRNVMGRIIATNEFEAQVCQEVLDAYHNGTNYFQNERGYWIAEYDMPTQKRKA